MVMYVHFVNKCCERSVQAERSLVLYIASFGLRWRFRQMHQGESDALIDELIAADVHLCRILIDFPQQLRRQPHRNHFFVGFLWYKYHFYIVTPLTLLYLICYNISVFNI